MRPHLRRIAGLLLAGAAGTQAWAGDAQFPAHAPHCALTEPPADAGAYATPGGFLLVYPRNEALPGDYTGCKLLWVLDAPDRIPLYLRLYFEQGRLRLARVHHPDGTPSASCDLRGRGSTCPGMEENPLVALHLATWPRVCTEHPDRPPCAGDPD